MNDGGGLLSRRTLARFSFSDSAHLPTVAQPGKPQWFSFSFADVTMNLDQGTPEVDMEHGVYHNLSEADCQERLVKKF